MEQFAPVKRSKDGQPVRYLIVDDSVFARKNLARMIETFGGQVAAEAGDGLTAISEFDRTHPDIVLMDITMPQMEGIEAAERIVQSHPEAGSSVRSHQVRAGRRRRRGERGRSGSLTR
jgi:two-component system chemotaxis response regulator CheY